MWAVLKKEFKTYFLSPIGYVFIGLFLAMFSILFYITTIYQGMTTFQYVFYYSAIYTVVFIIPLLTMRMFAEERKNGTEQLLITSHDRNSTWKILCSSIGYSDYRIININIFRNIMLF